MTDIKSARGLAWAMAQLEEWLYAYGRHPGSDLFPGHTANTIRDLCDEVERLREEVEDHEDDAMERHASACERD